MAQGLLWQAGSGADSLLVEDIAKGMDLLLSAPHQSELQANTSTVYEIDTGYFLNFGDARFCPKSYDVVTTNSLQVANRVTEPPVRTGAKKQSSSLPIWRQLTVLSNRGHHKLVVVYK